MKLTFYMKSGNRIVLRFVKSYEIKSRGNEITELTIGRPFGRPGARLLVGTIALDQIEAVTRS